MNEPSIDRVISPESDGPFQAFKGKFDDLIGAWAETHKANTDPNREFDRAARTKEKERMAELQTQLTDLSAEALTTLPDPEAALALIDQDLMEYEHESGRRLLDEGQQINLYRELLAKVVEKRGGTPNPADKIEVALELRRQFHQDSRATLDSQRAVEALASARGALAFFELALAAAKAGDTALIEKAHAMLKRRKDNLEDMLSTTGGRRA